MKKALLIVSLALFSLQAVAQKKSMRWGGGVDYESIHFGFSFHYVASSFKVFKNSDWQTPYPDATLGRLEKVNSPYQYGVGLGLLSDLRINDYTNLRFSPTILFADKELAYKYQLDSEMKVKNVKASLLELPLSFKFKSDRRTNYAVYVLAGGKYSNNISPKKNLDDSGETENEKFIKLKPDFFSYEFGIGVDIYFEYFKMSPELKWSQSFGNVLDKRASNAFNTPIDKLLLNSIQFSLFFE